MAEYVLGFKGLADRLGSAVVGDPLENEQDVGPYSVQMTTRGVMLYSRAANSALFLPAVQPRQEMRAVEYLPYPVAGACIQGALLVSPPAGVIVHGSHSGVARVVGEEFEAVARYGGNAPRYVDDGGVVYLAWHATIGEYRVAEHLELGLWGYHAGGVSRTHLGVEFAKACPDDEITAAQVETFARWFVERARDRHPAMPCSLVMHSETPQGRADGKIDPYPLGDERNDLLRARLEEAIAALSE